MVAISAYFSGSETSMMTLNRYQLRHLVKQGNHAACRVEKLLSRPDRLISLVLIGNNLVNIIASALGTIIGMRLWGNTGVAIATGALTFVILIFAEVLPKTIAALYPERFAYSSSLLLALLLVFMMPFVWLLNVVTNTLMRIIGIRSRANVAVNNSLSKDELRTIVNESHPQISKRNQEMLLSVLDLEKISINDIMVPRNKIIGINIHNKWKSIIKQLIHSPHSQVVLYRNSLDDAISMLRVHEAFRLMTKKKKLAKDIMLRAADEIYYIPEGISLSIQLFNFQNNKKKVGLVVNEYGYIKGLITVKDILKEIVGDFANSSLSLSKEVIFQDDGSLLIDGSTNIRELNKAFNLHMPENSMRTINGLILERLEKIPVIGTHIRIEQYDIYIVNVQNNIIKQVKIIPIEPFVKKYK